ncbi:hypothetical protein ABVV53_11510 [Novosphingobium sp. RD2P27]|uniref:EF-hand domain-containing protein n=1 Tax=Novosphingobium kalidii TaxID=3230299 RepID=A0ABV2D2H2_9SPHN
MKKYMIGLSMAALAVAGSAFAAPGSGQAMVDTNGDGVITRSEAQSAAATMFTRLDANRDGKLDQLDHEQRRQQMKTAKFDRLDANKDGQISREEFMADTGRDKHAAYKDGSMAHDRGQRGSKGDWRGGMRHGGHHGGMMGMARMADSNKDGVITQAELTTVALAHFDAADTNKDGQVTSEEQQAMREQMKAKWQQKRAQQPQN